MGSQLKMGLLPFVAMVVGEDIGSIKSGKGKVFLLYQRSQSRCNFPLPIRKMLFLTRALIFRLLWKMKSSLRIMDSYIYIKGQFILKFDKTFLT